MATASARRWLILLVLAGAATYANALAPTFVGLDARESIRDNPHLRTLWPLSEAMSLSLAESTLDADDESKGGSFVRRPVLSLSFALNIALLGDHPPVLHAVNVAIHLAAGLLLFGIVRRTTARVLGQANDSPATVSMAFAVALLWLLHPLQAESVTYLIQRAESLMGLFYLATLYASVRAFESPQARPVWIGVALAACALGMGTKESMVTAPLIVLAYDRTFVSESLGDALRRHRTLYIGLAMTWSIVVLLVWLTAADAARDFNEGRTLAYALAQPRVILHYLRLALWPDALHLYVNTYAFNVRADHSPWQQVAFPAFLLLGLLGLTLRQTLRRHWSGFAGLWFFVILAPTSTVVATSDTIQEHRVYLSLAAVVALIAATGGLTLRRIAGRHAAWAGVLVLGVVAGGLGWRTHVRNADFHHEFAAVYPGDLQEAYTILADHELRVRSDSEVVAEAESTLRRAERSPADEAYAHFLLGVVYERRGEVAAAAAAFRRVVALQPNLPHGPTQVGMALMQLGQRDEAITYFQRAIAIEPDFATAHQELGTALASAGRSAEAAASLERAIALQAHFPEALRALAALRREADRLDDADELLARALRQRPTFAAAHHERGLIARQRGDWQTAAGHFRLALEFDPEATDSRAELGATLNELGRAAESEPHLRRVIGEDPRHADALENLGVALALQGQFAEALVWLRRAQTLAPGEKRIQHRIDALRSRSPGDDSARHAPPEGGAP